MKLRAFPAVVAALLAACATASAPEEGVVWASHVAWRGDGKVECVRVGDADAASAGPEVVGVDDVGRVVVVRFPSMRGEEVWRHTARLTGLLVADVDPSVPGSEIYAGGHFEGESGGAVFQVVLVPGAPARVRLVHRGAAFVHAMARIEPARAGEPPQLLVADYAATVHLATPAPGAGPWPTRVVHVEPPTDVVEGTEMKDAVALGGRRAFVAVKSGRGVLLDLAAGTAEAIHVEPGGIARAAADDAGRLWLAGTAGRAVLLERGDFGWRATPLFQDTDGLRGVALGSFPLAGGPARAAFFGYSRRCHLLRPVTPVAWEATPVLEHADRGHWLAAADLVPEAPGDELAIASYGGTVEILVSGRPPRAPADALSAVR